MEKSQGFALSKPTSKRISKYIFTLKKKVSRSAGNLNTNKIFQLPNLSCESAKTSF